VVTFKTGQNVTRILVARGTTDAGDVAEVAYSDDEGGNWTQVDVGTTNGEFGQGKGCLFAFNQFDVWFATTEGNIFKSEDGGATWGVRENGIITTDPYNQIEFIDPQTGYAVGDNGVVARTINGGVTFGQVTDPSGAADNILSLDVLSRDRLWAGDDMGVLYVSTDGATTWSTRSFGGSGSSIVDIKFANNYVGFLLEDDDIYKTINGGFSWEVQSDMISNQGLVAMYVCGTNLVYVAGPVQGTTGFIAVLSI
jgi:photosystem II stability/assembly factor-like uncharacterized protein